MDPFELLKADHKKVAELFDRLESSAGKAKLDTFKLIKKELELHTHIEETIFYPALEAPEETHDLTLEAYEEHKVVKSLLTELAAGKKADDDWQAKAKVLRENVEHHVEEEENELFDKASDALDSDQLEALGDKMAAEKARKEGKAEPKGQPNTKSSKTAKAGIITRIANFVGFASSAKKKTAKKASKKSSKSSKGRTRKSSDKSKVNATSTSIKSKKPSKASKGSKASRGRRGSSRKRS